MDKTKILFICHGNICRSTMAQCIMQNLVDKAGYTDSFSIDSAATTNEEIGMPIYPNSREQLIKHNIPVLDHVARRIRKDEAQEWDYIVCMDSENVAHLRRIVGDANMGSVSKIMSFTGSSEDVSDPWYTRDFESAFDDIYRGCEGLLTSLLEED